MTWLPTALLLGLTLAAGLLLIVTSFPLGWRPSLVERVAPQLRHHVPASRLLDEGPATRTPWGAFGQILTPALEAGIGLLSRFNPGGDALAARLQAAGGTTTVHDHRAQQVVSGVLGAVAGVLGCLWLAVNSVLNPLTGAALILTGALAGVMLRDGLLTARIRRRRADILSEFPSVAELFALSVSAGESASAALERITRTARGELAAEFGRVLADMNAGSSFAAALRDCARRVQLAPVERFIDGVLVALERGTPLSDVLRAQAQDVRELSKRELMEAAGRKEIQMMMPVVFGILPLTILFAAFPGFTALSLGL